MSAMLDNLLKLIDGPRDGSLLRYGIANELVRLERFAEAVPHLEHAIASQPDYSAAYKLLGKARLSAGDEEGARDAWRRGIGVAMDKGDVQAAREMTVFARRLDKRRDTPQG
ncbi:tetratricopeptide repeat protein [Paludibacterium paludis]|uniref:TPR repeat-containing protein n=1 Tax=Paludibacterium paludis TaxID=1225769 RepID=A0A918U7P5_9NEIS|nr:tetratricopeptide repeat protein [Paludibacterium paludis]GGY06476.1 TPR repeat-containing protein [Paludibacterium paludis]